MTNFYSLNLFSLRFLVGGVKFVTSCTYSRLKVLAGNQSRSPARQPIILPLNYQYKVKKRFPFWPNYTLPICLHHERTLCVERLSGFQAVTNLKSLGIKVSGRTFECRIQGHQLKPGCPLVYTSLNDPVEF